MRLILASAFALVPTLALAHAGHGDTAGFLHGFQHPLSGIDHVLAMVAVGIFAYVLGGRALLLVPMAFVAMMAAGFLVGVNGISVPFVELGIALSSIVIGAAAAWGKPVPVTAAISLVGAFAVFHGVAHGTEMPAAGSGLTYGLGFVTATVALHAAGMLAALGVASLIGRNGHRAAQLAGGLFAIGGVGVLAGWL